MSCFLSYFYLASNDVWLKMKIKREGLLDRWIDRYIYLTLNVIINTPRTIEWNRLLSNNQQNTFVLCGKSSKIFFVIKVSKRDNPIYCLYTRNKQ